MGLFDNIFKSLDATLQAIEDGAIEKTLTNAVDMLEKHVETAPEQLEKLADMPQKIMETAEQKAGQITQTGNAVREQATRFADVVKRD